MRMKSHTQNQIIVITWFLIFAAVFLTADGVRAQSLVITQLHSISNAQANATTLALGKTDGVLYGTTYSDNTNGTVFSVNRDGSGYAVLHTFTAQDHLNTSFYTPGTGLPEPFVTPGNDGFLYGTTPVAVRTIRGLYSGSMQMAAVLRKLIYSTSMTPHNSRPV
jgi:uncharacterized repeat protein (TIGR03803 family)